MLPHARASDLAQSSIKARLLHSHLPCSSTCPTFTNSHISHQRIIIEFAQLLYNCSCARNLSGTKAPPGLHDQYLRKWHQRQLQTVSFTYPRLRQVQHPQKGYQRQLQTVSFTFLRLRPALRLNQRGYPPKSALFPVRIRAVQILQRQMPQLPQPKGGRQAATGSKTQDSTPQKAPMDAQLN